MVRASAGFIVRSMPVDAEGAAALTELGRTLRHAEYLRQINSNKAFSTARKGRWMTIATVAVAAAVSFVGFTGTTKLREQLQEPLGWSQQAVDLTYNLLVLLVLLLSILALVYRLPERSAEYNQAIKELTEFILHYDVKVRFAKAGALRLSLADVEEAKLAYASLVRVLPPSTDKDFIKAKKTYQKKRTESKAAERSGPSGSDDGARGSHLMRSDEERVRAMVEGSASAMCLLGTLRDMRDQECGWRAAS